MTPTQLWISGGIGLYLVGMVAVGLWASRRIKGTADYIVAGRRLPLWMAVGTTFATWFGAETCMGASGRAYEKGILGVIADPFGAGLCLLLAGLFFCRALYRLKLETVVDFFEARYGDGFGKLSAALYVPVYLGWVGGQLIAFGMILEALTGLPRLPSILVATTVVLVYVYYGGMWADTVLDIFRMAVLVAGLLVLFPLLLRELGGWEAARARVPEGFFHLYPRSASWLDWANYLQAWMIVGLGSLPAQDLLQRIFSAKDEKTAGVSALVAGGLYLTLGLLPVLLGIFGRIAVPPDKGDAVLIELSLRYLHPAGMALMLGTLLSAIMSAADSAILSPASIIGNNVVPYFRPGASEELKLAWCRRSVPLIGALSLCLALYFKNIYALCQEAWTFMLVSLTAPLAAGLYWKRANAAGAFAGSLGGLAAWILFAWLLPAEYPHKLMAFLASGAALAAASLLTHPVPRTSYA